MTITDPFAGLPLLIPVPQAAILLRISRAAAYGFASGRARRGLQRGALPGRAAPGRGQKPGDGRRRHGLPAGCDRHSRGDYRGTGHRGVRRPGHPCHHRCGSRAGSAPGPGAGGLGRLRVSL
jgi:hypothetical protein